MINKIYNTLLSVAFYPIKCISILIKKPIRYIFTLICDKSYRHDNDYLNNKYKKENDKTDSDFIIL